MNPCKLAGVCEYIKILQLPFGGGIDKKSHQTRPTLHMSSASSQPISTAPHTPLRPTDCYMYVALAML
jgi:hypothetical protein